MVACPIAPVETRYIASLIALAFYHEGHEEHEDAEKTFEIFVAFVVEI